LEENYKNKFFMALGGMIVFILISIYFVSDKFIFGNQKNYMLLNGQKYYESSLKDNADYIKLKKNWIESLEQVFQGFAVDEVFRIEAKSQNISEEEFVNKSLKAPSEQEIMEVYLEFKDSQLGGRPLEEVKGSIMNYLFQKKNNDLRSNLLQKYKFEVHMESPPKSPRKVIPETNNPSMGPKDAKITIVEFSDFECPYCQRSQMVNQKLREKYKDKIRWVFRDYPLPNHRNAMLAHAAANCAIPQNKFWEMFEILFQNTGKLSEENVLKMASSLNILNPQFQECIRDNKTIEEIQNDIVEGQKLGVNGTPAFFINGIMVEGAAPIETFEKIIEEELN
jgi:protein-disulfide isomerase